MLNLKTINLYRITSIPFFPPGNLEKFAYNPPGQLDIASRGWISPTGDGQLAYVQPAVAKGQINKTGLLALRTDKKVIPGSALWDAMGAALAKVEAEQGHRPGRKQTREIRETIVNGLLPNVLPTSRINHVVIWDDLIAIGGTPSQADDVLSLLHKTFPDITVKRLKTRCTPRMGMTEWLLDDAPAGLTIDRECELVSPLEQKAAVRYSRHPLDPDEIRHHIEAGKLCTQLALTWENKISFVLTEDGQIKRLQFLDILKEQAEQADNAEERFAAEFAVMAGELRGLITALIEALCGEEGQS